MVHSTVQSEGIMKKISIVIPTFNEYENIEDGYLRVKKILEGLTGYLYEILFIDNYSSDGTRDKLRILAQKDSNVKVILNAQNFGWMRSSFYGMISVTGDCVILLAADMQETPELIPEFIKGWEEGFSVVIGIKSKSKENPIKYAVREIYYKTLQKIADVDHIEQFMGFGLYDQSFLNVLRKLDDPMPYLRGMVAEFAGRRKEIEYTQEKRKKGKTHFSFMKMYDLAMFGITSYSKVLLRIATLMGFAIGCISLLISVVTFILKAFHIIDYPIGIAAISVAVFTFGSLNLFFIGLAGEYILNINTRVMNRPLVVEEERINF